MYTDFFFFIRPVFDRFDNFGPAAQARRPMGVPGLISWAFGSGGRPPQVAEPWVMHPRKCLDTNSDEDAKTDQNGAENSAENDGWSVAAPKKRRSRAAQRRKLIIVDGYSAIGWVLCNHVEVITLDYRAIAERVRALVEAFRRCGFRLACYFDAVIDASKERTWLDRREDSAALVRAMNGAFDKKKSASLRDLSRSEWPLTRTARRVLPHAFRAAGCEVNMCLVEADKVIAHAARARDAEAVLTTDSDMLVFGVERFIHFNSVRLNPGGGLRCMCVTHAQFKRKIGISRDSLFQLALHLGNDARRGVRGTRVRDAILAIRRGHKPPASRADTQAMREYYKPSAPTADPRLGRMSREAAMSWAGRFACGPLVESLSAKPIFASLRPIRLRMYKAVGCKRVSECMCDPRSPRKTWESGSVASIEHVAAATQQAAAAEVKLTAASLVDQVLDLKAVHPLLTPRTRSALKRQLVERGRHTVPPADELSFRLEDLHARTAFLEAAALLCACRRDNTGDPPYVWEYFDGPLYHYLCGCPDEIKES